MSTKKMKIEVKFTKPHYLTGTRSFIVVDKNMSAGTYEILTRAPVEETFKLDLWKVRPRRGRETKQIHIYFSERDWKELLRALRK